MTMGDDQHLSAAARRERRNGLWNIFDGLDLEVLGRLGLSEDILKQLLTLDTCPLGGSSAENANTEHTHITPGGHSQALLRALSAAASSSRSSLTSPSAVSTITKKEEKEDLNDEGILSDCCCEKARLYRSLSATVSEEIHDALQNRHRRNAVGNLFEILTPSQQLLLVEHLQVQLQGFSCFCDTPTTSDVILASLSPASAASSPSSPSPSDSSSPRLSQGGVVACR